MSSPHRRFPRALRSAGGAEVPQRAVGVPLALLRSLGRAVGARGGRLETPGCSGGRGAHGRRAHESRGHRAGQLRRPAGARRGAASGAGSGRLAAARRSATRLDTMEAVTLPTGRRAAQRHRRGGVNRLSAAESAQIRFARCPHCRSPAPHGPPAARRRQAPRVGPGRAVS